MESLKNDETELRGKWTPDGTTFRPCPTCRRIFYLISQELDLVQHSDDGATTVFKDPRNGDFWELTYPEAEFEGGGPPLLAKKASSE